MCKMYKDASNPDRDRMPYAALKQFPDPRGMTRHDVGLFEGTTHDFDITTPDLEFNPLTQEYEIPGGETVRHRSKKDRRRWCKGKPGREHVLVVREPSRHCGPSRLFVRAAGEERWMCYHQLVCERCTKILAWRLPAHECPGWQASLNGKRKEVRGLA